MDTKKLRQKILDLAIRGKLVPQDPSDEPASVLIEKIRAEKEQLIKEKKIKRDKNESYIYRSDKSYYEKFADETLKCIDKEIPFEIPESWEWCRLGSIVTILGDGIHGTPKYDEDGEYFFINGNNLDDGNIVIKPSTKTVGLLEYNKYQKPLNSKSVFVSINGTLGNVAFFNSEKIILGKSACYFNICGDINLPFIKAIIDSNYFKIYANDNATGSTIKNLSLLAMRELFIPLPSLLEQQRIISALEQYSKLINGLEQNKENLEKFILQAKSKILDLAIRGKLVPQDPNDEPASILLERIKAEHPESKKKAKYTGDNSHYQNLPQGWTECTLESIGSWSSGATPNRSNKMYYENGTVSWLKTGDLNDSYIDYIPEKITDLALKECSVRLNPKDSVLIAMYGATIGKIGILNIPAATNQACCTCITYSGIYNKFLFYLLMGKKKILQMKAEGGAQPNISKEKITNFPILLPPSQEQIRIVQAIENLFQRLDNIAAEL